MFVAALIVTTALCSQYVCRPRSVERVVRADEEHHCKKYTPTVFDLKDSSQRKLLEDCISSLQEKWQSHLSSDNKTEVRFYKLDRLEKSEDSFPVEYIVVFEEAEDKINLELGYTARVDTHLSTFFKKNGVKGITQNKKPVLHCQLFYAHCEADAYHLQLKNAYFLHWKTSDGLPSLETDDLKTYDIPLEELTKKEWELKK